MNQKMLVEPMISNFRKFNSNTGHAAADCEIMHALSHFSYHHSQGEYLLCDLQGGRFDDRYVLTDPIVLSAERKFGLGDLGADGIANFFYHHKCNALCRSNWVTPRGQLHYEPREGSLLVDAPPPQPQRFAPMSRLPAFEESDDEE